MDEGPGTLRQTRGRRGRVVPLVAAVVVLAGAAVGAVRLGLLPSPSGGPVATDASTCPARTGPDTLWVPGRPGVPGGGDRLVPTAVPRRVLVCRYAPIGELPDPGATGGADGGGKRPALDGSVELAGRLDGVPADLAWLPRRDPGGGLCAGVGGPTTPYLVGLTYADGVVWIAAPEQASRCEASTNGRFTSTDLSGPVTAAFSAGRWVGPDVWADPSASQGCSSPWRGRLGDDERFVPAGVTAVRICAYSEAGAAATVRDMTSGFGPLLAAVNRLKTSPWDFSCHPVTQTGQPYAVLQFRYAAGPPATVRVEPQCPPAVTGATLKADEAGPVLAELDALGIRIG